MCQSQTKNKPTLIYIITTFVVSGAEKIVHYLAEAASDKYDVKVIVLTGGSEFRSDKYEQFLLHIRKSNPKSILVSILRFIRIIDGASNFTIVHSHMGHSILFSRFFFAFYRIFRSKTVNLIETFHNSNEGPYFRKMCLYLSERISSQSVMTVVSETARNDLAMNRYITKKAHKKILVIKNAVIAPSATQINKLPKRLELLLKKARQNNQPIISVIGRLEPQKDPTRSISVFNYLKTELPTAQLFIAGDGSLRIQVEKAIAESSFQKDIHFLGKIEWVDYLLSQTNLLLLLSRWEGMPLVALEAIQNSVKILATNVGGIHEINSPLVALIDVNATERQMAQSAVNHINSGDQALFMNNETNSNRIKFDDMLSSYNRIYLDISCKTSRI